MATINLNQFKLAHEIGDVDLTFFGGENIMSVLIDPTETSTDEYTPGMGVTLIDLGSSDQQGIPIVHKRTLNSQAIFGTVKRSTKWSKAYPGQTIEIALAGCPMWFNSVAGALRGAEVSLDVANPGNILAKTVNRASLGVVLDKIAANSLGRVLIQADGITAGTST
jgi:hypothetical protein